MRPWSMTRIWSARLTVESRCAITNVVRLRMRKASPSWMKHSDSESRLEVHAEPGAVGVEPDLRKVVAVDEHAAAGRAVERRHQADHRRLPGAGATDEGGHRARLCAERDAKQHGLAQLIAEVDVVEDEV